VVFFAMEMVLRILAEPILVFLHNPGNVFDLVVTINSIVEVCLARYSSIGVFRSLNLLYLHPALRRTVTILGASLRSTVSNAMLLLITAFLFALLGVQLFAGAFCGLDTDSPFRLALPDCANVPRDNFNNIGYAMISVVVIIVGDEWRVIMANAMLSTSKFAAFYFVAAILVGMYLITSLFVAVLIETVQSQGGLMPQNDEEEANDADEQKSIEGADALLVDSREGDVAAEVEMSEVQNLPSYEPPGNSSQPSIPLESATAMPNEQPAGTAGAAGIGCKSGLWRLWERRSEISGVIVRSNAFFVMITIVIVLSMISLALESPLSGPYDTLRTFSLAIDIVTVIIFVFEAVLKMTAMGLYDKNLRKGANRNEGGYFNHGWNIFDFVLMLFALVSVIVLRATNSFWGRLLSTSRALRPFSVIGRYHSLRVVFLTLTNSLASLGNVAGLAGLLWFLFAVCGTRLFANKMNACTDAEWGDVSYGELNLRTKAECLAAGYRWAPFPKNFDTVGEALVTLFGIITKDLWKQVMFMTSSAESSDEAPVANSQPVMVLYTIAYTLVMTFFVINLLLSVIVDSFFYTKQQAEATYSKLKKQNDARLEALMSDLNDAQRDYVDLYTRAVFYVKPPITTPYDPSSFRRRILSVLRSDKCEIALYVLAIWSVGVQCFPDVNPLTTWNAALRYLDLIASIVFMIVSILFPLGYGIKEMKRHPYEIFTAVVNVLCLVGTGMWVAEGPSRSTATAVLVTFRIFRLSRVAWVTTGIRRIVSMFRASARSLFALAFILFLLIYAYAILGMTLFGRVKWGQGVNQWANFSSISISLLTLFRCMTFDNWLLLMYECSIEAPLCDPNIGECGNLVVSRIYFMTFLVLSNWIGINCFTAVLLESFTVSERELRFAVREKHVRHFLRLWKRSSGRENRMSVARLTDFFEQLPPPLGPESPGDALLSQPTETAQVDDDANQDEGRNQDQQAPPNTSYVHLHNGADDLSAEIELARQRHDEVMNFMQSLDLVALDGTVSRHEVFHAVLTHFYGVPLNPAIKHNLERECRRAFRSQTLMAGDSLGFSPSESPLRKCEHPISSRMAAEIDDDATASVPHLLSIRTIVVIMRVQQAFRARRAARAFAATANSTGGTRNSSFESRGDGGEEREPTPNCTDEAR
jgi:hypothetical protein